MACTVVRNSNYSPIYPRCICSVVSCCLTTIAGGTRSRVTAEQLDYEMELLRARREGREAEFKKEHAAKRAAARKKNLDAEMDDYFKQRDEKQDAQHANSAEQDKSNGVGTATSAPSGKPVTGPGSSIEQRAAE